MDYQLLVVTVSQVPGSEQQVYIFSLLCLRWISLYCVYSVVIVVGEGGDGGTGVRGGSGISGSDGGGGGGGDGGGCGVGTGCGVVVVVVVVQMVVTVPGERGLMVTDQSALAGNGLPIVVGVCDI